MSSLRKNIILNGINVVTGILFPVITFPYAARVLLPDGIGAVNFLNSIINYIILLTSLGIPMYAVKEVAKYKDDKETRDRVTTEILTLSIILCVIGYVFVFLLAKFIPQIHQQEALFYVLSLSIVFTTIGVNWFYQGIEDFKFITIRAVIIRTLSVVALFLFVRTPSDLIVYGVVTVGSTVGNNIVNFLYLKKHIGFRNIDLKQLEIKRHFRPTLQVFILNVIISLYIQLNTVMLGFMATDTEVGYFTAGTKVSHIGLTLISSIGAVLLPRCSHLIKIGDLEAFAHVINKSLRFVLLLSFPMTAGLMILSVPVIDLFCGYEYIDAIPILFINAPVIIFISLTNIMGIQILYPKDKVNIVIYSVLGGAILNLILNFFLIPRYAALGAAVATTLAEVCVLVVQIILGRAYYPFKIRTLIAWEYIFATIIMSIPMCIVLHFCHTDIIKLIVGFTTGIIIYICMLIIFKDPMIQEVRNIIKQKYGK